MAVIASVPAMVGSWSSARLITSGFRASRDGEGDGAVVAVDEAGFAHAAASTMRSARERRADMTDLVKEKRFGVRPDERSRRMARAQLVHVAARDVLERDPQCIRRDRHAPERIAQLEGDGVAVECAPLQKVLPDVSEHLASLLGQSGGGVDQTLFPGQL